VDYWLYALTVYDDGSGPALCAGGEFFHAGGLRVNRIARWDGSGWWPLSGPLDTGMNYPVHALTVFDDGSGPALYAGGQFEWAGGIPSLHIGAWRCQPGILFIDGFESGDTVKWVRTVP